MALGKNMKPTSSILCRLFTAITVLALTPGFVLAQAAADKAVTLKDHPKAVKSCVQMGGKASEDHGKNTLLCTIPQLGGSQKVLSIKSKSAQDDWSAPS